ncbi:MAG: RHS repeat-associated core domain-containing protein, partial [Gaiellaceae bacterium]
VSSGAIVQRRDYDAWGVVTASSGSNTQALGYAGGLTDASTGLVRFGARDYDPAAGRWTAKDPVGFGGGSTNLMAYAAGDPIDLIDPTGTDANDDLNSLAGFADYFTCGGASKLRDTYIGYNDISQSSSAYRGGTRDAKAILAQIVLSGAGGLAAGLLEGAPSALVSVFWSGGESAQAAATSWALANGGRTLELSPFAVGNEAGREAVTAASRAFAAAAEGEIQVFQASNGVRLASTWATTEYPTLMSNPNVTSIVYHIVE